MKRKTVRRTVSILCALITVISAALFVNAGGGGVYSPSGYKSVPKMAASEIWTLLNENPIYYVSESTIFEVNPSVSAPYAAGKVKKQILNDAAARLNVLRRLAGLDPVALDDALCEEAQYGAVLLAASEFSHFPAKPSDMSDSFYNRGYAATSSSNIYAGMSLMGTPAGFMEDTDPYNIDRVGHRRWQLNPEMGKIGFGYAYKNGYPYTAEKVFDRSASAGDYDFISWPSSGHFPTGAWFESDTAWSVTLNPKKYGAPGYSSVKVTLTELSTGKTWNFSEKSSDGYFNVDNQGFGVANCIIFRPEPFGEYSGLYAVNVTGISDVHGGAASISFKVCFFRYGSQKPEEMHDYESVVTAPTCTKRGYTTHTCSLCGFSFANSYVDALGHDFGTDWKAEKCSRCGAANNTVGGFRDVLSDAFYASPVLWAVENGITKGTSKITFSPDDGCTRGQIVTFLWRAQGSPSPTGENNPFRDVSDGDYYFDAVLRAVENGITKGTSKDAFSPDDGCTRAQIVTFLWRSHGCPVPSEDANPFSDVTDDDYFRDAVLWAVENGVTRGTDEKHFSPSDTCTRAQVVTFLYRDTMGSEKG